MGYLRFIRVATCCIVIQMTLTSIAFALPSTTWEPEDPSIDMDIGINEAMLRQPDTYEDKDSVYRKTTTGYEDMKTEKGKRKQESKTAVDTVTHSRKAIQHGNNQLVDETKVYNDSESHTNYNGRLNRIETIGSEKRQKNSSVEGNNDESTSNISINQKRDIELVGKEIEKKVRTDKKDRKIHDQYEDINNGKRTDCKYHERNAVKSSGIKERDRFEVRLPDDFTSVVTENSISKSEEGKVENSTHDRSIANKDAKTKTNESVSHVTKTTNDVQQHNTNMRHETPTHKLQNNSSHSEEATVRESRWDIQNVRETVEGKDGLTVTREKTTKETDETKRKHVDGFTFKDEPKSTNNPPTELSMDTEIIDGEHYTIKERKETDTQSTLPNGGGIKSHHLVVENTETYDRKKIEPEFQPSDESEKKEKHPILTVETDDTILKVVGKPLQGKQQ